MEDTPLSMPKSSLLIPFSIVVAGLIVGGAIYFSNARKAEAPVAGAKANAIPADVSKVVATDRPFIGNPNAKLTIAYWFDYQCPYCKINEQKNISRIVTDYVNTGKVKLIFKDFQFLGAYSKDPARDDSMTAAIIARAVWETAPDKFYQWHSAVMNAQDTENAGWGNEADVLSLTKTISGIDVEKVKSLSVSKKNAYKQMIDADKAEGTSFGIEGTPGMIVGKQMIGGYEQDYTKISSVIDAQLK
jgi:protein-disulfide isomerase